MTPREILTVAQMTAADAAAVAAGTSGVALMEFAGAWSRIEGDIDYEAWRRSVVESLAQRAGAAVFSHFVAINAAMSSLLGSDQVIVFRPDHTSCTTLSMGPGGLEIVERGAEAATGVL